MAGEIRSGTDYSFYYMQEANFGVTPSSPAFIEVGLVNSGNLKHNFEKHQHIGIGTETPVATSYVKESGAITAELELTAEAITLAKLIMNATELSFTVLFKKGTAHYVYAIGSRISKTKFTAEVGAPLKLVIDFLCQRGQEAIADPFTTPDYTTNSWTAAASEIWTVSSVVKSGGFATDETVSDILSWEVEIDRSLEIRHHMGANLYPARIQRVGYTVKGKFAQDFENSTELDELIAGSDGTATFAISSGDNIEVVGTTYDSLEVPISELELIEFEVPFEGRTVSFT